MQPEKLYHTTNLKLASVLEAMEGVDLIESKRLNPNGKEITFYFSPYTLAEKIIDEYFASRLMINPKKLFSAYDDLRDRIYQGDLDRG